MDSNNAKSHLEELLNRVSEGSATDDDVRELNSLLREDAGTFYTVARRLIDDSLLQDVLKASVASELFSDSRMLPSTNVGTPSKSSNKKFLFGVVLSLATAALLLVGVYLPSVSSRTNGTEEVAESTSEALSQPSLVFKADEVGSSERLVAVITELSQPEWDDEPLRVGQMVGLERLQLKSGILQIEFFCGATMILEGPFDLEIESPLRAVCRSGKVRVSAPPQAHGFTIAAPGVDIVDLGTEFAVQVDSEGISDIHVLDGEVALLSIDEPKDRWDEVRLLEGQSARFDWRDKLRPTEVKGIEDVATRFVSGTRLLELVDDARRSSFTKWADHSSHLDTDPTTIIHYDFNRGKHGTRLVKNLCSNALPILNGAVVGSQWTTDRWERPYSALAFNGISDRVRLNIPGEYDSVSMATWVSVNQVNLELNGLLLTDGWDIGEVHWQITSEGCLKISISDHYGKNPKGIPGFIGYNYISPPIFSDERLGRWVFLASVIDGQSNEVRHYLDGELISSHPLIKEYEALRFGPSEIGNWSPLNQKHFLTRGLNGKLDELILFSRPLIDEEVSDLYHNSRPAT